MEKDIDLKNREDALMEIMHMHNMGLSPYSICRSLSGCWPSCEAVVPQGAARGVNLSRHSVPHSNAASFDSRQSLKGSYAYCRWHRHWQMDHPIAIPSLKGSDKFGEGICRSLSGCWLSRRGVAPQGAARGVNLSRHSVPSHGTVSSLNVDLSQPFRLSENPISIAHGAAIEHFLSRRSAPHSNAASFSRQSLKGSDRYSLRHRRRICAATSTLRSLKGSYGYCRWHRHWQMDRPSTTPPSLKGSDKFDIIYSHNL